MPAARLPRIGFAERYGSNLIVRFVIGAVPILLIVILWSVLADLKDRPRVFPPLEQIWGQILQIVTGNAQLEGRTAYGQILATSLRLAAAFALSFTLGVALGIAAGRNRLVFSLVENLVWIFMAVPSVVWVFLFAVARGLSPEVPIGAVSALLTPMFVVLVAEGAKSVPADLVEMARSYKVTRWQRLTGLFLPYLVPYITSASRTAFALGVKLVIVAEVVGLPDGIGFEIHYWYGQLFMGPIVAWGIIMIVLGLLVDNLVFGPLERRVGQWKSKPVGDLALGRTAA